MVRISMYIIITIWKTIINMAYAGLSLKSGRAAQHRATFLKISLMWLKNIKYPLMLVANRQFYHSTWFTLGRALLMASNNTET